MSTVETTLSFRGRDHGNVEAIIARSREARFPRHHAVP